MDLFTCTPENAPRIGHWIRERGGVAIFRLLNKFDPAKFWVVPVLNSKGERLVRPSLYAEPEPSRVIMDPAEVVVETYREIMRFHIEMEYAHGLGSTFHTTRNGTRKILEALEKVSAEYGVSTVYETDFYTHEAVIKILDTQASLSDWETLHALDKQIESIFSLSW